MDYKSQRKITSGVFLNSLDSRMDLIGGLQMDFDNMCAP